MADEVNKELEVPTDIVPEVIVDTKVEEVIPLENTPISDTPIDIESKQIETPTEQAPIVVPEVVPEPIAPVVIQAPSYGIQALLMKARLAIQNRKRKKLDRIMLMFNSKLNITNDEVEKLLHISDATATRYLSILEKEGKIEQTGKVGRGVSYIKL